MFYLVINFIGQIFFFTFLKLYFALSVAWAKEKRVERFPQSQCGRSLPCTVASASSTKAQCLIPILRYLMRLVGSRWYLWKGFNKLKDPS